MHTPERRNPESVDPERMRERLNPPQQSLLRLLEYFGWELRFVREPPSQPPVPVIFAGDASWAVISPDGKLDEGPHLRVRHPGFERRAGSAVEPGSGSSHRPGPT